MKIRLLGKQNTVFQVPHKLTFFRLKYEKVAILLSKYIYSKPMQLISILIQIIFSCVVLVSVTLSETNINPLIIDIPLAILIVVMITY